MNIHTTLGDGDRLRREDLLHDDEGLLVRSRVKRDDRPKGDRPAFRNKIDKNWPITDKLTVCSLMSPPSHSISPHLTYFIIYKG